MVNLTDQQLQEIFDRTERESNQIPALIAQLNEKINRLDEMVSNIGRLSCDDDQQAVQP